MDCESYSLAVRRYHAERLTLQQAGQICGVSAETIRKKMISDGIKLRRSEWSEKETQAVVDYCKNTDPKMFSIDILAKAIGRPYAAVALKISRLGLGNFSRPKARVRRIKQHDLPWSRWTKFEHPRGMKGKKHTTETKLVVGAKSRKRWDEFKRTHTGLMSSENRQRRSIQMHQRNKANIKANKSAYSRCAGGSRPDLGGRYFRSAWEANYARTLNLLMKAGVVEKWEYEPEEFEFHGIKRGARFYTPDFKVWEVGKDRPYFVEIKGWMDKKSQTKLRRMKKYHPDVDVRVVGEKEYAAIQRANAPLIPCWEFKGRKNVIVEIDNG